jgi:integrase
MAGGLTARKVETAKPGKYGDGGNLYLIVSETGARKWVLRFTWRGRAKEMGLGSAASVPLAEAREKAASARRKIAQGLNPIDERKRDRGIPTFGEMADDVRETLSAGFRNEKHKAQWKSTLETYAAPLRGNPVDTIATDDVLAVLKPIWTAKAETASRVRGRIEKILDAAKAKGYREGENPARWRGHHAAMPYDEVAGFVAELRKREASAALALELCILTAARSGEILGMRWPEIDFDKKIWAVPAERMKAGREHRVPLSPRAVAILRQLEKAKNWRVCLCRASSEQAAFKYGDGNGFASDENRERHRPRLPVQLPGLGRKRLQLSARNRRDRTGACDRRQGRTSLSTG